MLQNVRGTGHCRDQRLDNGVSTALKQLVARMGTLTAAIFKEMVRQGESHPCQILPLLNRALSVPAPEAEAILAGELSSEVRTRRTQILGRFYVYASHRCRTADEESAVLKKHGDDHLIPDRLE